MTDDQEVRVCFDQAVWKKCRAEIEAWLNEHCPQWRCFSTHYWDGVRMSNADVVSHRSIAMTTHLAEQRIIRDEFAARHPMHGAGSWTDAVMAEAERIIGAGTVKVAEIESRKTRRFWVAFPNNREAVMFKLRWGGEA